MRFLRRAPREVYRVYSEDEFLADPLCDTRAQPIRPVAGGRRLSRIAGATVLVAAAGAVGGLIAGTSAPSLAGSRRRERQRTHSAVASIGSTGASRPRVWRTRAEAGPSGHVRLGGHAGQGRYRTPPVRQRPRLTAAPAYAPPAVAAVAVSAGQPDQTEFGFER
jgi:hypothetical protein